MTSWSSIEEVSKRYHQNFLLCKNNEITACIADLFNSFSEEVYVVAFFKVVQLQTIHEVANSIAFFVGRLILSLLFMSRPGTHLMRNCWMDLAPILICTRMDNVHRILVPIAPGVRPRQLKCTVYITCLILNLQLTMLYEAKTIWCWHVLPLLQ